MMPVLGHQKADPAWVHTPGKGAGASQLLCLKSELPGQRHDIYDFKCSYKEEPQVNSLHITHIFLQPECFNPTNGVTVNLPVSVKTSLGLPVNAGSCANDYSLS